MEETRVIIQKTRKGYAVKSFDFTGNIYEVFEGEGSLARAFTFAESGKMKLLYPLFTDNQDEGKNEETG